MRQVEACGLRVGAIGLGTWQLGTREWGWDPAHGAEQAVAILRRARELGVTLIDTAEIYGFGASERLIGHAITADPDARDDPDLAIATKVLPVWPTPRMVQAAAARSLTRLARDHIDLYQVHSPNPLVPQAVTMDGLRTLQAQGRIRHVGVSNYTLARWRAAETALGSPVVSNQVQFSLLHPLPARSLVPYAQATGRLVIAYSPLAQGVLAGTYTPTRRPADFRTRRRAFRPEQLRRAQQVVEVVNEVAAGHGATPAQVALAWVISHPNTVAIPGAKHPGQVEANAAAAELTLTGEEIAALSGTAEAYTAGRRPRPGGPGRLRPRRPARRRAEPHLRVVS